MSILQYINHLPTCNTRQNWTEYQQALSACPPGPETDKACEELQEKMELCTCNVNEELRSFARAWFIAGVEDPMAQYENRVTDQSRDEYFNHKYLQSFPTIS